MKKDVMETPATISETIYRYIKNAILAGELRSRQRIIEKDVAKLFNVSQTPAREAIRRLAGEKLLVISARKEIIVAGATWKELQELYEVIGFLDYPASLKAMDNLGPGDLNELKRVSYELGKSLDFDKSDQYLDNTLNIHEMIWKACGNKFLCETLTHLMEKVKFLCKQGLSPYPEQEAMNRSYEDHCNLVRAMENKDALELKKIIERHWYLPY
jgi:DNA-binding GntR family transcriptional regulator